ncbi:MAG: universal stress protein [Deltaproteobacteria bacterium]|nr:universal stress protein [Deltaproteobacteria bacterium]MDL1962264.1 universal stress protein [Deltaproteobacteria bacterium]
MKGDNRLFARILTPVDGSKFSLKAVRLAKRLAEIQGSELLLLHVLDTAVFDQLCRFNYKPHNEVRADMEGSARAFLNDMSIEISQSNVAVSITIKEGIPHEVILDEAVSWGADLIVMGKLGKRGVSRILLGSVAERVIEFANLPVLLANAF